MTRMRGAYLEGKTEKRGKKRGGELKIIAEKIQ